MEANNLRPQSQQELGSSTTIHNAIGFLILVLLTLLQFHNKNSGNPFEMGGATTLLFIMAIFVYAIALVGISKPTPNTSYIPILRRVCFIFGGFACGLLLLNLVTPVGWLILSLCACTSAKLLYDSYEQILKCFQQIFQSINHFTSQAIVVEFLMSAANSTEQQGVEMLEIVVESPMSTANSTQQQGVEMVAIEVEESDTLQG